MENVKPRSTQWHRWHWLQGGWVSNATVDDANPGNGGKGLENKRWDSRFPKHKYTHIFTYIYIHIHIIMFTCIHINIHTYIVTYIHIYIHIYIYTYIHIYIYTYIHIYTYTYIHVYIYTYIHIYIYTYIHVYIYTCIHIYIYNTYLHMHMPFVCDFFTMVQCESPISDIDSPLIAIVSVFPRILMVTHYFLLISPCTHW